MVGEFKGQKTQAIPAASGKQLYGFSANCLAQLISPTKLSATAKVLSKSLYVYKRVTSAQSEVELLEFIQETKQLLPSAYSELCR